MKRLLLFPMLTATAAYAHPGHETAVAEGAAHWLLDLDHVALIAAVAVSAWLAIEARPLAALRRWLARD